MTRDSRGEKRFRLCSSTSACMVLWTLVMAKNVAGWSVHLTSSSLVSQHIFSLRLSCLPLSPASSVQTLAYQTRTQHCSLFLRLRVDASYLRLLGRPCGRGLGGER